MLGTVALATAVAAAASGVGTKKDWDEYQLAHRTRGQMVNSGFRTVILGAAALGMAVFAGVF